MDNVDYEEDKNQIFPSYSAMRKLRPLRTELSDKEGFQPLIDWENENPNFEEGNNNSKNIRIVNTEVMSNEEIIYGPLEEDIEIADENASA